MGRNLIIAFSFICLSQQFVGSQKSEKIVFPKNSPSSSDDEKKLFQSENDVESKFTFYSKRH